MPRPIVAITIGDPAGVGPEIVVKALARRRLSRVVRPLAIGSLSILARAVSLVGAPLELRPLAEPEEARFEPGVVDLIDIAEADAVGIRPGEVQAAAGRAAFSYIEEAARLARSGAVGAIATAPVNKAALAAAGVPYLDHTAILAALTDCHDLQTLFVVRDLRIFFLTRHLSLRRAIEEIDEAYVYAGIVRSAESLRRFGFAAPRLAVAALNPHAGEGGMFGDEEERMLRPAILRARADGYDVEGPLPADSVFHFAAAGRYDAVLSLFHDQGHIAAKMYDFERTVGITTGLPFVRTSVDHGTAFDIAWQGIAGATSMAEAIRLAGEYARRLARGVRQGSVGQTPCAQP